MKKVLYFFFISLFTSSLWSQELLPCGTVTDFAWLERLDSLRAHDLPISRNDEVYYVNIQFHSVGKSDGSGHLPIADYLDVLAKLNTDFRPYNIQFVMESSINKIENDEYYDLESTSRASTMIFNNKKGNMVNVFAVRNALGNAGFYSPSADGIVMNRSDVNSFSTTLTHEMGHMLSLPHTFSGWEGTTYADLDTVPKTLSYLGRQVEVEFADGRNCTTAGDRICDTKADYLSERWSCISSLQTSAPIRDPEGKMFSVNGANYMSYANDNCTSEFSSEQTDLMIKDIRVSRFRSIWNDSPIGKVPNNAFYEIFPIDGQEVKYDEVELDWEPIPNATKYLVEIYRANFLIDEFLIGEYISNTHKLTLTGIEFDLGRKYYYRVRPFNHNDTDTEFSDVKSFVAAVATDVNFVNLYDNIKVYPTLIAPHSNTLYIEMNFQSPKDIFLSVRNMQGQKFLQKSYSGISYQENLDLSGLIPGVYALECIIDNETIYKKFIIQ